MIILIIVYLIKLNIVRPLLKILYRDSLGWSEVVQHYLLGVSGVGDGADVAVAVHYAVAAGDLVTLSLLLAVLVVGELVVLHVERELVGRTGLQTSQQTFDPRVYSFYFIFFTYTTV